MPFICSPNILSDASDLNFSEPLTVALLLTAVFTTTKFNDFNFLATTVSNYFSFNFNAFDYWSADLDVFTISDHQNLVKLNSFTCCDVQLFQANCLTFAYSVLFTTTLENRVHINSAFRAPPKILSRARYKIFTIGREFYAKTVWKTRAELEQMRKNQSFSIVIYLNGFSSTINKT
ncbi:hypothetical protein XIS1_1270046 [Xenorhabdus innexi]|uniref:Uncharacterized protein n=1 Tax=Xenorhabdus innexi TaxID=290109 RepID=A0A1N6MSW0_9GAMM|nr:hypothetical protein XIS1_1270046 [Xenorhabdus innexi]